MKKHKPLFKLLCLLFLLIGCLPYANAQNTTEEKTSEETTKKKEVMPEFPGGEKKLYKYLKRKAKRTKFARKKGIKGTVYVSFVIMEDGSVGDVKLARGLPAGGGGCDYVALKLVEEMPKWTPAMSGGKAIRQAFTLPVKFR